MKITILAIGHLKEAYWKAACAEYIKRLSPFAEVSVVEYDDVACPEGASEIEMAAIKEKEGSRVLKSLKPNEYLCALDLNKKEYDSLSFSSHLMGMLERAGSHLYFVIGGSLGLSDSLKKRANESITLSQLTFPHQMTRLILLEQLYRAFKIAHHEPYHK